MPMESKTFRAAAVWFTTNRRALRLRLKRIHRKIAKVEEEITEVGRPFSVRLRAGPEAVCEGESGLMLHALSCCGSNQSGD